MLIGLSSFEPQVGKSLAANYFRKKHGFIDTEMSDAICIIAEKFFGYNGDKADPSQRKILQDLGLMGKNIHPTIWFYHAIGLARRKKWGLSSESFISPSFLFYYNLQPMIEEIEKKGIDEFMEGEDVIMGGVRGPKEADEILKIGGKVYVVTRDDGKTKYAQQQHEVESKLVGYDKFTGVIENNGTIEELYEKIDNIVKETKDGLV